MSKENLVDETVGGYGEVIEGAKHILIDDEGVKWYEEKDIIWYEDKKVKFNLNML